MRGWLRTWGVAGALFVAGSLGAGCRRDAPRREASASPSASARAPLSQRDLPTDDGELSRRNLLAQVMGAEAALRVAPSDVGRGSELLGLLLWRSEVLGTVSDLDTAMALGEQFVKASPADPRAWLARASARSALHDLDGALQDLEEATRRGARPEAKRKTEASVMQAKGRYDEALVLRRAARLARPDVITTGAEAALLAEMGRTEEAEALFVGAQLLHRDTAALPVSWLYFQHGTMWERNGQQERARALFRAANERFPAYAHAAGHLALLEPPERAIELLRPLADGSEDPEYSALLGEVLRKKGDAEGATRYIARARAGYDALAKKHPMAFADHAAWFFAAEGGDARRAVELAQKNAAARKTERAFEVLLVAAVAANDQSAKCAAAAEGAKLQYASSSFRALAASSGRSCPAR